MGWEWSLLGVGFGLVVAGVWWLVTTIADRIHVRRVFRGRP